jgi:hypothetical protein
MQATCGVIWSNRDKIQPTCKRLLTNRARIWLTCGVVLATRERLPTTCDEHLTGCDAFPSSCDGHFGCLTKLQRAGAVQDAARFLIISVPRGASWTAAALCRFLRRTQAKGRNLLAKDGRCRPDGAGLPRRSQTKAGEFLVWVSTRCRAYGAGKNVITTVCFNLDDVSSFVLNMHEQNQEFFV